MSLSDSHNHKREIHYVTIAVECNAHTSVESKENILACETKLTFDSLNWVGYGFNTF